MCKLCELLTCCNDIGMNALSLVNSFRWTIWSSFYSDIVVEGLFIVLHVLFCCFLVNKFLY